MESLSKTAAADATQEKGLHPVPPSNGVVSDSVSLTSYKEYPVHRPLINRVAHPPPQTHAHHSFLSSSPSKAFPETSSAAILSALRNLQEKIRKLELEKGKAELSMHTLRKDASHSHLQSDGVTRRLLNDQTDTHKERRDQSDCNQVLISHLAAAESRCAKLERQLDYMRRMLRSAKSDRIGLLKHQASMEIGKTSNKQSDLASSEHAQLEKLERLEQEYVRLTHTQHNAEMKIQELEIKLLEEEHQRKLVQDKANQLQTGLEANRILLQSVSPHLSSRQSTEKKSDSKKRSPPAPLQSPCTQPHYRLSLKDVPFVAGTSVGCSHSVRANVQSVLSLLKQHQPHLCNSRVLANNYDTGCCRCSDSSSSSSSASEETLSELLQAMQEELRLMSSEQDELIRQVEASVSDEERKELQREQERLLLKIERKGEQISKLYKHRTQIKKFKKEADFRHNEARVTTTVSTRGRSAGSVKVRPGERSRRNLKLLRDMKALQTSLRT